MEQEVKGHDNTNSSVAVNNLNDMAAEIYWQNKSVGWWTDEDEINRNKAQEIYKKPKSDWSAEDKAIVKQYVTLVLSKLALVHSEVSEALEGIRKNLMDDHLPHRPMGEVEVADSFIRLLDLSGFMQMDVGGATREKFEYNKQRPDHKKENRDQEGGKTV